MKSRWFLRKTEAAVVVRPRRVYALSCSIVRYTASVDLVLDCCGSKLMLRQFWFSSRSECETKSIDCWRLKFHRETR